MSSFRTKMRQIQFRLRSWGGGAMRYLAPMGADDEVTPLDRSTFIKYKRT